MTESEFMLRLGRLVVVAAWADGKIATQEFTYLRKLLGHMSGISGADWVELNDLLENPVDPERSQQILDEMLTAIKTNQDKELVIRTISELVRVDGIVTDEEVSMLDKVRTAVEGKNTGLLKTVGNLVSSLKRRQL